eukprot:gene2175-4227_t
MGNVVSFTSTCKYACTQSVQLKATVSKLFNEENSFSWERQWYAVHIVQDVPINVPTKITLLEKDYVIWRHASNNKFSAFVDICPHRLAPISEGRIETRRNTLQCSYHGWEFNNDGKCTKIPQLEDTMNDPAVSSPRACLISVPISIRQDTVFLWPDISADGRLLAALTPPNICEEFDNKTIRTMIRDLPYGYDTLAENLLDPAHLPFSHHMLQGHRDKPDNMAIIPSIIDENIFLGRSNSSKKDMIYTRETTFIAPSIIIYKFITSIQDKVQQANLVTHITPVAPGRSRLVAKSSRKRSILSSIRWLDHLRINEVFDGDLIFLHKQERLLRQHQPSSTANATPNATSTSTGTLLSNPSTYPFYTPTKTDSLVNILRIWLRKVGQPTWVISGSNALLPEEISNRKLLLDRYNTHTQLCSSCKEVTGEYMRERLRDFS